MKPWQRVLALLGCVGLIVLALPILGGLLLGGLFWLGSERTIYQRVKAPGGWTEARVQFDDGGAMTGWNKIVFVRPSWLVLDNPWLSCRAFFGDGTDHIRLAWRDNSTLLIRHGFAPEKVMDTTKTCGSTRIVTAFDPQLTSDEP